MSTRWASVEKGRVAGREVARWLAFVILVGVIPSVVLAQQSTPEGYWLTIDDETGLQRSIIRIQNRAGKLDGRIVKLFPDRGEDPNPICEACRGELEGRPILGMTIMWGLDAEGDGEWDDGRILDPVTGKLYRCSVELVDYGRRLKVRGYVGIPLFGRTQYWVRVRDENLPEETLRD